MSFANANLPIQTFINNYGNTGRTYEALDYVRAVSNANTSIQLNPNSFLFAPGKLRRAIINYWPILCDVDGSCDANVCNPGVTLEPEQKDFIIDRCTASMVFSIEKDNIRLIDNNAWDFSGVARAIVNSAFPQLRRQLALDWVTYLTQLAGLHPDGNYTHRITVTNPTNGVVNPIGLNEMMREYQDNGLMQPYIMGGAEVYNWISMRDIGGLNAQGQYINRMPTTNAWYDDGLLAQVLDDEAAGGWIIAIDPQVFKYVYYLENAGLFATTQPDFDNLNELFRRGTETLLNGVLVDPVTGIPWDFDLYYSPCGKIWNFQLRHRWNFFVMPNVACLPQGVNGIWLYRTCPYVIAPCPTGDTPSPAIVQDTFDWDPGAIYPRTIYSSVIAGQSVNNVTGTQNGVVVANDTEMAAYMTGASQIAFITSGSNIRYTGYSAISASFVTSGGTVNSNFA
jgi:hypothetical protein